MARKKQNNNRKKTIQRRAAGPQSAPKARVIQNGARPRNIEHNLIEQMGKKAGMHSANGRMACEMYMHPSRPCVPVIPFATEARRIQGAGLHESAAMSPPHGGVLIQGRRTESVSIGSVGNLGYILFFPDIAGDANGSDTVYTDPSFTGAAGTIDTGTTLGVVEGAMVNQQPVIGNTAATYRKFLGAKMTLKVNEAAADSRDGTVMVYNGRNVLSGVTPASVRGYQATETYPNSVFSTGQEISVRATQGTSPMIVTTTQSFDAFASPSHDRCMGFIFTGFTGTVFDVELEWSCFFWGHQIPRSINPIIDTAAVECLFNCVAQMGNDSVGFSSENASRLNRELLSRAEHHTLLTLPKPLVSGLWPIIKQMAVSAGPALLKALF